MLIAFGCWLCWRRGETWRRCLAGYAVALVLSALLAAPAGYVRNVVRYGNPLGPAQAVAMTSVNTDASRLALGILNTVRLATDFVSLDGLPPAGPFLTAQHGLRRVIGAGFHAVVPASLLSQGLRAPFLFDRPNVLTQRKRMLFGGSPVCC